MVLQVQRRVFKQIHPSKVRSSITCADCGRPRCIFAKLLPSATMLDSLDAYTRSVEYTCGAPLFGEHVTRVKATHDITAELKLLNPGVQTPRFYVEEQMNCSDNMELCYYNYAGYRGRVEFRHVCALCGNGPDQSTLLCETELGKLAGQTPLPLCTACHTDGTPPVFVKWADRGRTKKKAENGLAAENVTRWVAAAKVPYCNMQYLSRQ